MNKDLDTGEDTRATEYELTEMTYGELLLKLKKNHFSFLNNELCDNILSFYSHTNESIEVRGGPGKEKQVAFALVLISRHFN